MNKNAIELTEDELRNLLETREKAKELKDFSNKKIIDKEIEDIMKFKDYKRIKIKQLTDDLVIVLAVLACVFSLMLGYYLGKMA